MVKGFEKSTLHKVYLNPTARTRAAPEWYQLVVELRREQRTRRMLKAPNPFDRIDDADRKKWAIVVDALTEFLHEGDVQLTNEMWARVADRHGICAKTLRTYVTRARDENTLARRVGSGRETWVLTDEWIQVVHDVAAEYKFELNVDQLADMLWWLHGWGSRRTIQRLMELEGWTIKKTRCLPYLTEKQKQQRIVYARWLRDTLRFVKSEAEKGRYWLIIMQDEKYFHGVKLGTKLYIPPGTPEEEIPVLHAKSKTDSTRPKIMAWAAVAQPVHDKARGIEFDGKLMFELIGDWFRYTNNGAGHQAGDKYFSRTGGHSGVSDKKMATVDGTMQEKLIKKCITKKLQELTWVEGAWYITDGAGGHGMPEQLKKPKVNEYYPNPKLTRLNELGAKQKVPCTIKVQSPNTPDASALDCGGWTSMDKCVPPPVFNGRGDVLTKLAHSLEYMWTTVWDSNDVLPKMYDTLELVCEEIIKCKGGNEYKMPHKKTKSPTNRQQIVAGKRK